MLEEIKQKRDHYSKHFRKEDGSFVCHQSLGLAHYFNGETFEEIENIPFPEGKEIKSDKDLEMIDIPSWASVELSEDKKTAWFKDKKGVRIQEFKEATVCDKKEPHSFDEKGKVVIDKSKLIKAKFKVIDNHLGFELPDKVKAKDLKAFDDTDVTATNNGDTELRSDQADTALGGGTEYAIFWKGSTGLKSHALIKFTLPTLSGTISAVKLYLYQQWGWTPEGYSQQNVHSVIQTGWTEAGATYNKYNGTNAWNTAGCSGVGTDYNSTIICHYTDVGGYGYRTFVLMGTGSDNPLTLSFGDTVNLMIKDSNETGSADLRGINYYPKENATNKPYIEITYTPPTTNIKSINGLAVANIKSINGVAIANVKSFNGLT